ncbi:MAG: hypothetical protein RLZZ352_2252 [Pseudomonadota bacterium]|jgi:hypothetical protein
MKTIELPHKTKTSRLGFGGTILKGGSGRSENLRMLNSAYEAGFRHYDVAPSYGLGVAESILGEFIAPIRSHVTITTKVGLPRPKNPGLLAQLRGMVRPLISFAPSLRRKLGRSVQRMSGSAATRFDLDFVKSSVDESFRELKTDYIDLLLLHEITPEQVSDELYSYVQSLVNSGRIHAFGVGSYRHEAERVVHQCPNLARIVQTSWSVGDKPLLLEPHTPFRITHGSIRKFQDIQNWLVSNKKLRDTLSKNIGYDLSNPDTLGDLMMAAALSENRSGIVLVSSTKINRLRRHAEISTNESLITAGSKFNSLFSEYTNENSIGGQTNLK